MQCLLCTLLVFFLPLALTMNMESCRFNTSSTNFTLANGNLVVDVEKFLLKWFTTSKAERNKVNSLDIHLRVLTSLVKVRSSFDVFYLRSEFYKYLTTSTEQSFAAGGLPFFASYYNSRIRNNQISTMLSFQIDDPEGTPTNNTSFETVNTMVSVANGNGNTVVTTLLLDANGKINISLADITRILQSVKGKMLSDKPNLGLITPIGDDTNRSICDRDAKDDDVRNVMNLAELIFLGPFECHDGESPGNCFNKTVRAVETCEEYLAQIVSPDSSSVIGIVMTTTSFGKDYWSRAELWCLLSEYAEESKRQVIMIDEDGFIRDYVDGALVWSEGEEIDKREIKNRFNFTYLMTGIIGSIIVVVLLVLVVSFQYSRNQVLKAMLTTREVHEFFQGSDDEGHQNFWNLNGYNTELEIAKEDIFIDLENVLGSGNFCTVYKSTVNGLPDAVAVKMTKGHSQCGTSLKGLLSEIKVLSYLGSHEHIIGLVGAYTAELEKGILYVVLELCPTGSLEKYLRLQKSPENSEYTVLIDKGNSATCAVKNTEIRNELMRFCQEICTGVKYLVSKRVIHGDLATRNVLLTSRLQAKISDFGMSRRLYEYAKYVKEHQEPLPWKWMAPETLLKLEFTEKSDIWAFGVTIWEIFSLGNIPYPGLAWHPHFPKELAQGLRMEIPDMCPQNIYDVMLKCWNIDPDNRPTFSELQPLLTNNKMA